MTVRINITLQPVQLVEQRSRIRQVTRAAGSEVAGRARFLASRTEGGGRVYYGIGSARETWRGGYQKVRWQASLPGEPPVNVTGDLVGAFRVLPFRSGLGVAVRDTMFYAKILETGADWGRPTGRPRSAKSQKKWNKRQLVTSRSLAPRPFLTRALAERAPSLGPRMAQAIADDVRLKRLPPRRAA